MKSKKKAEKRFAEALDKLREDAIRLYDIGKEAGLDCDETYEEIYDAIPSDPSED